MARLVPADEPVEKVYRLVPAQENPTLAEDINPTSGMSTFDRVSAGAGRGMVNTARGTRQRIGELADTKGFNPANVSAKLFDLISPRINYKDVEEQRKTDAPLMNTTGGKVGNVIGTAASAAPTMFLPGGNTYTGASVIGGLLGLAQPTTSATETGINTGIGTASGAAGKYVSDKVGQGARFVYDKIASKMTRAQAQNASKEAVLSAGRGAGYVVPPSTVNPTKTNQILEGISGKLKTAQAASIKNQGVTNALAKQSLGLPDDAPITTEALSTIRTNAGAAYESLRGAGRVKADPAYVKKLDGIASKFQGAAKDFPEAAKNDVVPMIESLKKPEFDAGSAVDMIRILRNNSDKAFASGDKALASANRQAAGALEDILERHLVTVGAPSNVLKNFREARTAIAKTYSVEKALSSETGNVSALSLAKQWESGKPLSGGLETAARFGSAFPKSVQNIRDSVPMISPLDTFAGVGTSVATSNPLPALAMFGRPAVRSAILSKPYQSTMLSPSYSPGLAAQLLPLLDSPMGKAYLRSGLLGGAIANTPQQ